MTMLELGPRHITKGETIHFGIYNPATTDQDGLKAYLGRLQQSEHPVMLFESATTLDGMREVFAFAFQKYMTHTGGVPPPFTNAISGDQVVSQACQIVHGYQSVNPDNLNKIEREISKTAIGAITFGNGNDRGREHVRDTLKPPMPWEWKRRVNTYMFTAHVSPPQKAVRAHQAREQHLTVGNYVGAITSAHVIKALESKRNEWQQLTHKQRLRRERSLVLREATRHSAVVSEQRLAGFDVAKTATVAKRIQTGVSQLSPNLKIGLMYPMNIAQLAAHAARLAVGIPPPGSITDKPFAYMFETDTLWHVDGDLMGTLYAGTQIAFSPSSIPVPMMTEY